MRKGGNHKLCPTLSPGKSKEGLFGSFIFSVLVAIGFISTTGDITLTESHGNDIILLNTSRAILLGLILAPIALIGDLIESVFKRASQLKDSGSALPGMGGVMDLLDSLLLAAPICLVYFLIIIRYFN